MDTNTWIVIGVIVALIIIAAGVFLWRRQRTEGLKARFGPEYLRAVEDTGSEREAEAVLSARKARVRRYHLRPLSREDKQRYFDAWRRVQSKFVDDPRGAARQADDLLGQVMAARGYPPADIDQRLEDVSVDHGEAVQNYRVARGIVAKHAEGVAGTEDMRQAVIHYRTLFEDLVGEAGGSERTPQDEVRYA